MSRTPNEMNGADILVECLKREGITTVFGIPGGANLPTFDALYKSDINVILTRHEQGAAHMADGFARATGKVGVCFATSGPGATNLVTGIATAQMDSIPIVAITGQVRTFMIGNDAFQEADTIGITRPIVKHSYLLTDVKDIARTMREAFHIAATGRPGPVLIDVPVDVSTAITTFTYPDKVRIRGYKPTIAGHAGQVDKAVEAIRASSKPLLYVGGGAIRSGAAAEVTQLARTTKIPVTTTLLGLGAFPETDPLSIGMLGMHGFEYTNLAVSECDLLIAVGARFDDRVTGKVDEFASHAIKIQIDVDPSNIGKTVPVDIPIVGDVKHTLQALLKVVTQPDTRAWLTHIEELREQCPLSYNVQGRLLPQYVIQQISDVTAGNAVVVTGVGQHQMLAAQFYQFNRQRSMITSGGLGTMGFGLPAAIGAQLARPNDVVWDIDGDGSFEMTHVEMMTAVANNLPIKVCLLNNKQYGMVRQWQDLFYDGRYSSSRLDAQPDFVKLAEAYGAVGIRVTQADAVRPAIEQAMEITDRPVLIEFMTAEEDCWPMIAPGKAASDMLGTYESLKETGGKVQPRKSAKFNPDELSMS
jgi:acetolactate synthase I/II/III large subunit